MPIAIQPDQAPLNDAIFTPLHSALEDASHRRSCKSFSDQEWLEAGVSRVLHEQGSGRGFLQTYTATSGRTIQPSLLFASLASHRRLLFAQSVDAILARRLEMDPNVDDPLTSFAALDNYDVYAGDGHYHEAATHDQPIDGTKYATGQFLGLNIRSHALIHLTVADQTGGKKKEHDMRALKRLTSSQLRQGAQAGRRVIWIWDRAGLDATFWQKLKQSSGVYFISRAKEKMTLQRLARLPFNRDDPINDGVEKFDLVDVSSQALRCVTYRDPATGRKYQFLTSLVEVPPGLIALLYKLRWDIEKVFDEMKTKLEECKAWASSETAKAIQATMMCITHNLLYILERRLAVEEGIRNEKEEARRLKRAEQMTKAAREAGRSMPPWPKEIILRTTQRALAFIRWVRSHLGRNVPWGTLIARLEAAYAGRSG